MGRVGDLFIEGVEKVPKEILELDLEKNELTECATLNDHMVGKGQVSSDPQKIVLTRQEDFFYSLVS